MPELPEVETVRRGLSPFMVGARLIQVEARRPDLRFPFPANFVDRLTGAHIAALDRRGKYLTAALSTGETLIMHLGMSGRFSVTDETSDARPGSFYFAPVTNPCHDHVRFVVQGERGHSQIVFNDPRRFGFMDIEPTSTLGSSAHFAGMGPEPLAAEFTADALRLRLDGRSAPLKSVLMDQSAVAGLGNIYVCEALWRARLSPRRRAGSVSAASSCRLHRAIREVLLEAIDAGGSTLRDFARSDGSKGYFQHHFSVYGREGEPCPACSAPVRRFVQGGRSTFACLKCQR
ncbi:MAG: bifunctional DNA-formamidopyrimidine glycosylase/DNA-(apurinic or apyrimidinic site) lyase [Parvularculaceae bacterium]